MGHDAPIQRTAPIAIAPKPPRQPEPVPGRQITSSRSSGAGRFEIGPASLHAIDALSSPCQACRFSGVRCTTTTSGSEDDDGCMPCQASGVECSLASPSPRIRKRKHHGDLHDDDDGGKRGSPGISGSRLVNSSLSSTAASSSFLEDMANVGGPTMLKRTLGLQEDRYSQYIGPTTDFEPSLINLSPFDPHDESLLARGTLRKVSDSDAFLMLPDNSTPGYEHVNDDLDAIERIVAPHGRRLVDLYFEVVHPGLPIIQKGVFLEKYERSYREFAPPILAVVYLLAINWWDHAEDLARLPHRPDVRELEAIVRATLDDAMYRPKLSTVQAGLLLSQRPEGDQWAPTAQLVAIAQELGLHLDCTSWKIPPWEKGLRRRLAWALYMQDKWGALVHGRPSHIFASNWAVRPLRPNDFPDVEWDDGRDPGERHDIERGRLVFLRFIQLSEILSEILDTFYTLQAMQTVSDAGAQGAQFVLSLAKPIQLKLKEWYGALPVDVRLDSYSSTSAAAAAVGSRPPPSRLSCIGYLHLGYFAAEITLHRRIIRSLSSSSSTSSSTTTSSSTSSPSVDPYVQHICRGAAKARLISAMDFVNRLTPQHLRSFWYFASRTNFALIGTFGSLLWATSPGREEAEWYRRRLGEYRWTLSVSSKQVLGERRPGAGLTDFAISMLDISTGLLKQLPEKPSMSRTTSVADFSAPGSFLGSVSGIGSYSNLASGDVSGVASPESESESSGMDDYATPI